MGATMQLSDRIGRRMKLQDLHILMTVVQAGSMGRAAERLNSTQPAISRSVAELEHTLGVRLLDRNRQGVEPTEYGRALLAGGGAAFDELREAVRNIEFLIDPTAGEVRIGCSEFFTTTFVSIVVDQLSQRYPRIVFDITAADTETLLRELKDRNFDFLIARKFGPISEDEFLFEMLYDESYGVVAGAKNPWVGRRRPSFPIWRTNRGCCHGR
jgi:DNA-binding transcriptional LysR family regulator